jgi:hypothetical protein
MAYPKPTAKSDESIAHILIVTGLVFALFSCLISIGIF